jgi:hypothetical protein
MKNTDFSQGDLLVDEVDVNLNMLRSSMMNMIGCHIDNTNIVTINERSLGEGNMKLVQKLSHPTTFCHSIGNNPVLSLSTRTSHRSLPLRRPGD